MIGPVSPIVITQNDEDLELVLPGMDVKEKITLKN
jgi:hypothetical protein